jgi:hypothetical protein
VKITPSPECPFAVWSLEFGVLLGRKRPWRTNMGKTLQSKKWEKVFGRGARASTSLLFIYRTLSSLLHLVLPQTFMLIWTISLVIFRLFDPFGILFTL